MVVVRSPESPVPLIASLVVGLAILGWAVAGLYTSIGAELSGQGHPYDIEASCHGVMSADPDSVIEVLVDGEPYDGGRDYESRAAVGESVDLAEHGCQLAGTRRVGRTIQVGLVGAAVLCLAARWGRSRREYLA